MSYVTFIAIVTHIYLCSVWVGYSRMAAPGGAISAALRRSQDLDIGEQKHRHADRSARSLQAHRFFSSLHSTSNKLLLLENYTHARCRATVFVVYFFLFFFCFSFNGHFRALVFFRSPNIIASMRGSFLFESESSRLTKTSDVLVRKGVAHA